MQLRGRDQVVKLRVGRGIGAAHYGDPNGTPVFLFHGFPGSRLEGMLADEPASEAGVHLIALDRPGFGLSDFAPRRTVSSWADDVAEVATILGIDRFGVIGVSGGGPFALACAARIPDRLLGVAFVCGGPPPEAPTTQESAFENNAKIFRLGRYVPIIPRMLNAYMARKTRRNPDDMR
ncbi:MAG: alpha/beta hydrolase, partial [Actinobacteria bacterium]|nr:alpha/beta hydrolase [Actinomycetota bacterium]